MAWFGYRPKDGHVQYTDGESYSRGISRRTARPYFSRVIISVNVQLRIQAFLLHRCKLIGKKNFHLKHGIFIVKHSVYGV